MKLKTTLLAAIVLIVVTIIVTIIATLSLSSWYTRATDKKRRAEYDAAAAVSKQINEQLRTERDAAIKAGDDAAAEALAAKEKLVGYQAEFAKFGAAGAAAIKRQEEAAKKYEAEKISIRNSTDACALCRNLCADRAAASTVDNDVACAPDYCNQYCGTGP